MRQTTSIKWFKIVLEDNFFEYHVSDNFALRGMRLTRAKLFGSVFQPKSQKFNLSMGLLLCSACTMWRNTQANVQQLIYLKLMFHVPDAASQIFWIFRMKF